MENLIPDFVIETIYIRIKSCIEKGENYDVYMRIFKKLNAGIIPEKIKKLIADSGNPK